ncbi:MAG: ABC transporter permease [Ornithinimicrobium sp.]
MTLGGPEYEGSLPGMTPEEVVRMAREHKMQQVGVRPPLGEYIRDLWRHRGFLLTMSSADFISRHQQNYLGQLWALLNPLLLGAAYFAIFGLLLDTSKDVDNFICFLIVGLFAFIFISSGMNHGARSLVSNTSVVRALRFPRVVLPISVTLTELFAALPAFAVAVIVAVISGESIQWAWMLYPVGVAIVYALTTGIAIIAAVVVYKYRDAANLIPLLTRMLRYVSGVFFLITAYADGVFGFILAYQPVAIALTMLRQCLMSEYPLTWTPWLVSSAWAILFLIVGFLMFWRAEATYGRR